MTTTFAALTVEALDAVPGNAAATAPATLVKTVQEHGITRPLVIADTGRGPVIVDGRDEFAAAKECGITEVPVTYRPLVRVRSLTAHPGNVRADLKISKEFVTSIRVTGVRIPLLITQQFGGTLRVVDGHRRLAAAAKAGITEVRFEFQERDEAGQFLDMLTTSTHREDLTAQEQTAALFAAADAGASTRQLAAAAGVTQKHAKAYQALGEGARDVVGSTGEALTLEELAELTEFEDDPQALERLAQARSRWNRRHIAERIRAERKAAAAAERQRAELETAGARIRDIGEITERARPVDGLTDTDGTPLDSHIHAQCGGTVWILAADTGTYEQWCTSPILYGHTEPHNTQEQAQEARAARAAVRLGNVDWDTATAVRREWITTQIKRRNLPRDQAATVLQAVTTSLITGAGVISDRIASSRTSETLGALLGLTREQTLTSRSSWTAHLSQDPRKAALYQLATLAACWETEMARTTWRTDEQGDPRRRTAAGQWLATLTTLGYEPSPVEQAVIDGTPYSASAAATAAAEDRGDTL